MGDERRAGDERPFTHDPEVSLTLLPSHAEPFRWLPRHGDPSCIGEWFTQHVVRVTPALTLILVAISLLVQLWVIFR